MQQDFEFYKVNLVNKVIQFYEATGSVCPVRSNMWKISGTVSLYSNTCFSNIIWISLILYDSTLLAEDPLLIRHAIENNSPVISKTRVISDGFLLDRNH